MAQDGGSGWVAAQRAGDTGRQPKRRSAMRVSATALILANLACGGQALATSLDLPRSRPPAADDLPRPRPLAGDPGSVLAAPPTARMPRPPATPDAPSPRPADGATEPVAVPRPPFDAAAEAACRRELVALGVTFEAGPPLDRNGPCGIVAPITVTAIAPGIRFGPAAPMNCAIAAATSKWTQEVVVPVAQARLAASPVAVVHNSTFVCRTRNSQPGARISEHAFGNAVDIVRFRFASREDVVVAVQAVASPEAAFQREIRDAACGYFTTVLGPGTDEHHADHFHFDLARRRAGYRYCK